MVRGNVSLLQITKLGSYLQLTDGEDEDNPCDNGLDNGLQKLSITHR